MKVTNRHGLPEILVRAVERSRDAYSKTGDYSVTELMLPPLMRQILKRRGDEIAVDASTMLYATWGTEKHAVIAACADEGDLAEASVEMEVCGSTVSGSFDLYTHADHTLWDFKRASVWSAMLAEKPEWQKQLNMYALMIENTLDLTVDSTNIVLMCRDWNWRQAKFKKGYPPVPAIVIPQHRESRAETLAYMQERVKIHQLYDEAPMDEVPLCTREERWADPDKWAVKKKGNKRAMNGGIFETEHEARAFAAKQTGVATTVEHRPSEPVRCMQFCDAAPLCPYGQEYNNEEFRTALEIGGCSIGRLRTGL